MSQMVQLLLKTKLLHSDAKNIEEKSALDITTNEESISILVRTKAEVINPWPVSDLRTFMSHIKGDITEPTQCLSATATESGIHDTAITFTILSFMVSTMIMFILVPSGKIDLLMLMSIGLFFFSYMWSVAEISPTDVFEDSLILGGLCCVLIVVVALSIFRIERKCCGSRCYTGGNRW
ncbi:hypothetical protein JHK87_016208 [Glycine soja]|nr:hypothetical protein JHK87_016208 [Glycine soja]